VLKYACKRRARSIAALGSGYSSVKQPKGKLLKTGTSHFTSKEKKIDRQTKGYQNES
jgi:hypothetical protein